MRSTYFLFFSLFLLCLLTSSVSATFIANVPDYKTSRNVILSPGLHMEWNFPVGGADTVEVGLEVPAPIRDYFTISDPTPRGSAREIIMILDVPSDAVVPPGRYDVNLRANEIPKPGSTINTAVSAGVGFTFWGYTDEPYLDVYDVNIPPISIGDEANFTVRAQSRTTLTIPLVTAHLSVLDGQGNVVATGEASRESVESGQDIAFSGLANTKNLEGGVYKTVVLVDYSGRQTSYNLTVLRVGTLSIDVASHTQSFIFNQTNKFEFTLKSNWNKELSNVLTTVDLLGQSKRSAPDTIAPFSAGHTLEVYFDRSDAPPGPVTGTMTIDYQERGKDAQNRDTMVDHSFTVPISVVVTMPNAPVKVETPVKITTAQIIIAVAVFLLVINVIVVILLLRKRKPQQPSSAPVSPTAPPTQK